MNVQEGLREIRERLVENEAQPDTLKLVDAILQRASLPAASDASANSLLQLVRMLMRSPIANSKPKVYNDLVKLEAGMETKAEEFRAMREEEDAKPLPKSRRYYKDLKKKGQE